MLVNIQLKIPLFLINGTYPADSVLEVEEEMARRLVQLGQADLVTPTPPTDPHQKHVETATHDPHKHSEKATRHSK